MKNSILATLILLSFSSYATILSSFTCSVTKGCSPLVVNLTDHSTGSITSWYWDLGNGNTSTQQNPSTTYFTPGTYTVKLIVSDGTAGDSSTQVITVFSPPTVDFTSDETSGCPGDSVHFTNLVTPGSAPVSQYAWGFGNGVASSDTNASYRYELPGTYDITLIVQDTNGCNAHLTKTDYLTIWPKPAVAFTATPLSTCGQSQTVNFTNQTPGNNLSYTWVFGDGASSTSTSPSHLYSYGLYRANLIVSSSNGCIDSVHQNISVVYIKADFSATQTTICAGQSTTFLNQSPMAGTSWHWDFGDGTTSGSANPIKSYSQPGVYTVTFIISDASCRDSSTKVAYITVTSGFSMTMAADTQNSCNVPFVVNFTSTSPSGTSLTWNFGDGNISHSADPTNTYTSSSQFNVSLTGIDSAGCTVTISVPGFINTTKPLVLFHSDTILCPGTPVVFSNNTINGIRYLWNFGDGDTSTQYSPIHTYHTYGRYTVSLTAWDALGCDSTLVKPSSINVDSTIVGISVNETYSLCPPLVSVFQSHANRNDLKYTWDFGDGYTDTAANPTHIYFHPGRYTVKLTGISIYGCTNTVIDSNLIVVQGPSGNFSVSPTSGCVPLNVSFSAQTSLNTQSVVCDLGNGTLYTDSLNFNYTYNTASIFHPRFILTDHVGCSVPYTLDSIVTHALPLIDQHDTSICAGSDVAINLGSDSYLWGFHTAAAACDTCFNPLTSCDTCSSVNLQPTDTSIYRVTATNSFGCSSSASFAINVDPLPVVRSSDTVRLCRDASFQIANTVIQAANVVWVPSSYLSNDRVFQPTCTPSEDIDYTVTAYNTLGCSATATVPVKVYQQIPLSVSKDTTVCAGSSVQLYALVTDTFFHSVTYTWGQNPYLNNDNIADPVATIGSDAETFQVTATSGSCPAAVASVTVSVAPSATVQLPAEVVTSPFVEIPITPVSGDLTSYSWSAKNELSCTECATTTITPTESQVVYLTGRNQYGCTTTDSMLIHIVDCDPASIFVPNTFTPNGDGVNDILYVRSKTLAQMKYFRIFNRWGGIVFETSSMSDGWDGMANGKLAEEGVYVYQISGKCENGYDVTTNGTVTLIR